MLIIISKNYKEMSKRASQLVVDEINRKPNLLMGFATGATPVGMYKELIKSYKKKEVDFSKVNGFMLDEYYPISKKNKNSYYYYMHKKIFDHINIKKINTLDSESKNPKKLCGEYDKKLRKNPFDLQVLGVGINGHIAFNEPGSSFNSKTRLVKLTAETRKINLRFFDNIDEVPRYALTIGIGTILKTRKIILLASGKNKSSAIKQLVEGRIEKKWPVSALKNHKNLIVILDKDAASGLK